MSARAPERGLLPIALPVILLGMIGGGAFLFSRILLNVDKKVAVAVAIMTAFNLLAFFSFMSSRIGKADPIEKVLALGVLLVPVILGAAVAAKFIPTKVESEHPEGPTLITKATLVAKDLKFDKSEIKLSAGVDADIELDNKDTQPHNVIVFNGPDEKAPPLDDGQPIAAPGAKATYSIKTPAAPGKYFFHCQIHPAQMTGDVVVVAAAQGGVKEAGPAALALTAKDLKFDKAELKAKAGEKVTLNFENKESVPHNVQIFSTPEPTGTPSVLNGEPPLTTIGKTKYEFTAPAAPGRYAFHCQFHPTQMKGTLVVE